MCIRDRLYVALIEMALPGGEPLPRRGWLGLLLGFAGLAALVWPSLSIGLAGNRALLWALAALLAGALSWTVGSIVSRHARLKANSFVAASWQMLAAGICCTALGTAAGQWPQVHLNAAAVGALVYLVTGGSLLGYTGFIYLLEHVPVAKVMSYTCLLYTSGLSNQMAAAAEEQHLATQEMAHNLERAAHRTSEIANMRMADKIV